MEKSRLLGQNILAQAQLGRSNCDGEGWNKQDGNVLGADLPDLDPRVVRAFQRKYFVGSGEAPLQNPSKSMFFCNMLYYIFENQPVPCETIYSKVPGDKIGTSVEKLWGASKGKQEATRDTAGPDGYIGYTGNGEGETMTVKRQLRQLDKTSETKELLFVYQVADDFRLYVSFRGSGNDSFTYRTDLMKIPHGAVEQSTGEDGDVVGER